MKKVLFTVLAGVLAGMTFVPARAEDDADKKFEFNGEVRARYEYLNNYLDLTDNQESGDVNDDAFSIAPYRVMIGITGNFAKNVTAHVDLQYVGHAGDEFNPSKDNPFWTNGIPGPTGQGDVAYQYATQAVQLYQGFVDVGKIGGSDFGVRFGRAEHTYGTELFLGDNDFYSGLSYDGARGMWQHGSSDLNFFYYKIADPNCFSLGCAGLAGSYDTNLWGATYDWKFKSMGAVGGYVIVGQDLGGYVGGTPDTAVNTYGARWNRGMMTDDKLNMFDWNIEYALQSGDFGGPFGGPETSIKAWVGEGWFAYNFKVGDSHGRVHIGTLMTSGEDNSTTNTDSEGFASLFGDFHANNRFGDMDWVDQFGPSDITDYNIGYEHWIGDAHYVMFAYHMFMTTESYTSFIDGKQHDGLGDEIDLKYGYQYSKNLAFEVMIGQASGDKYAFGFFPPDTPDAVQRAYVQAKLNW